MLKPSGVESAKQSPRGSSPGEGRGAELFSTSVTVQFGSVEGHLGKAVARILWGDSVSGHLGRLRHGVSHSG